METACPSLLFRLGRRVWPEAASPPRRPHESRHQLGGTPGPRERGGPWPRPRRQRWWTCSRPLTIRTSVRANP